MTGRIHDRAGRWFALVAGSALSMNQTGIGVAVYDCDGHLAGSRFAPIETAIRRGDMPDSDWSRAMAFEAPETLAAMQKRLGSTGNAMSIVRWEGGNPTLVWDDEDIDRMFGFVASVPYA